MTAIRDIMTHSVASIRREATLAEALQILTKLHVGCAPVVSADGTLVGVISELAMIDVMFDENVKHAPVSEHMTRKVQAIHPGDPLSRAAQLFALYLFRRLPVVENGKLVGIVSRRDLMNYSLRTNELLTEPLVELLPSLAPAS